MVLLQQIYFYMLLYANVEQHCVTITVIIFGSSKGVHSMYYLFSVIKWLNCNKPLFKDMSLLPTPFNLFGLTPYFLLWC
jgi:hypothetical protein